MERSTAVEEHHQSCNSNLVSKSVGSLIKIDSISIDLVSDNGAIDAGKCEHFSIRGYVSEMCKKDWKKGWPFALGSNHERSEEQTCLLPPLTVPKFRWWRCQNCQRQMGTENITNNNGAVLNCCSVRLKSISPCSHGSPLGDTAIPTSFQHAPKVNVLQVGGIDSNPSANLSGKDRCHSQIGEKKEEKIEAPDNSNKGDEDGLEISRDPGIPAPTAATEATSSEIQERCHMDEIAEAVQTNCDESAAKVGNGEAINAFKEYSSGHPSWELDENEYASSDKSVSLPDKSAGLSRKKTRKVRLLKELLAGNGDANTDLTRTEDSLSIGISDASADVSMPSSSQGRLSIQENLTSVVSKNRKRKLTQDEDWKPLEMSMPSHVSKKALQTSSMGAGTTDAIASSGADEHTDTGVGFQTGFKAHLTDSRIDKGPVMGKKRQKTTKVAHESMSTEPLQENVAEEIHEKRGVSSKVDAADSVSLKPAHTGFTDKGKSPLNLPALKIERSSCKKKNKKHQGHDELASLIYRDDDMLREGPSTRKDEDDLQTGSITVPFRLVPNAFTDHRLNLSLNSYMDMQRCNREAVPQLTGMQASLTSLQKGAAKEGQTKSVNISFTHGSCNPSEGEPDAYFQRGFCYDVNNKKTTHKIPFLNVKRKHASQTEGGRCTDSGDTSNKGKTIEIQENSAVSRKLGNRRAESVELMEIVELMAKNQYERCLPDADSDKQPLDMAKNTWDAQMVDLNEAYVGGDSSFLQEDNAQRRKPRPKNGGNAKIRSGENVGTTKQKTVDYLSNMDRKNFNMSHLEQTNMLSGVRSFPQYQEKLPSSGVQCFPTSLSRQVNGQNSQWIGNVVGHSSSHASFPSSRAYDTCEGAPQQSEALTRLWSSMYPSHQPFVYNIPQKHADNSINKDVLSHCPSSLTKGNINDDHNLNFLNPNVSSFDKKTGNFDSETLRKKRADYSFACKHSGMGSMDLHSNDTISAMHLLSLMHASLPSGATNDASGSPKFLKRSPFPYHNSKEFPGMPWEEHKTDTMKHPLQEYCGKSLISENSNECSATIPTVGASTFSFEHGKGLKKTTDFENQVSLKSRGKGKTKISNSPMQNRGRNPQHSVLASSALGAIRNPQHSALASSALGAIRGSLPGHSVQKMSPGTSNSMLLPQQFHDLGDAKTHKLEAPSASGAVQPQKGSVQCSLNRNPADFSVPEEGNEYTIAGEDLKFRRPVSSENRAGLTKLDGHKRQTKTPVLKEPPRRQMS